MVKHRYFLSLLAALTGTLFALILLGQSRVRAWETMSLPEHRQLVKTLGLTDLSLWTEARYTRHLSQTDFFTPFQDFPASFEHFPAGSLAAPAPHLVQRGGLQQ